MSTVMYLFGVVGNMGGGLIDQVLPQNWIPMFSNHADMMLTLNRHWVVLYPADFVVSAH